MGFELSREDFSALPIEKQNLVMYDNLVSIRKEISLSLKKNKEGKIEIFLGYLWLFLITVYIGLKKFIPFI